MEKAIDKCDVPDLMRLSVCFQSLSLSSVLERKLCQSLSVSAPFLPKLQGKFRAQSGIFLILFFLNLHPQSLHSSTISYLSFSNAISRPLFRIILTKVAYN